MRGLLGPSHTFESVGRELLTGLEDGSLVLDGEEEAGGILSARLDPVDARLAADFDRVVRDTLASAADAPAVIAHMRAVLNLVARSEVAGRESAAPRHKPAAG